MDTNEFNKIKQEVLTLPVCYRELEAKEIVALGENHYSVGNATFEVNPAVANKIDYFAGIKQGQSRIAQDSYGDPGLTNLRNFFGQAETKNSKRIVLVANSHTRQIVDAIPIRNRMITSDVFFDFAEMFMDKNSYLPDNVEYTRNGGDGGISIRMMPVTEQIMEFSQGDEFMSNGICLLWTPGKISLSNYYKRLVCSNGQTQTSNHTITKVFSPEKAEIEKLLNVTAESEPFKKNIDKMLVSAQLAMKTSASVHELGLAVKMLNKLGLEYGHANQIIPYERIIAEYENAGYSLSSQHESQAKSDKTMWEVFNMLTFFATHNTVWAQQDIRRTSLMQTSMDLLLRERDIKEYYNIF